MADIDSTVEIEQIAPAAGPEPGALAHWASALGMREGQLWTAIIALAVAIALGIAGIPATARSGPPATGPVTTLVPSPAPSGSR